MENQTAQNSLSELAEKILPKLPYPEKLTVYDVEAVLRTEQEYLEEIFLSAGLEGPIDVLINPDHEHAFIALKCFIKGLPVDADDVFFILDMKETILNTEDESEENAEVKYDFNCN